MLGLEALDQLGDAVHISVLAAHLRLIDAGDCRNVGPVAAIDLLEGIGNLADGRHGAGGRDGALEQISLACLSAFGERVKSAGDRLLVALGPEPLQLVELLAAHGAIVDLEDGDVGLAVGPVFVHADDGLAAGIDAALRGGRRLLDHALGNAGLDGLGHAAELLDFLDMLHGARRRDRRSGAPHRSCRPRDR